jgi:DNA-binding GntR family transcriptional regulator
MRRMGNTEQSDTAHDTERQGSEGITDALRELILTGELAAGARNRQEELAERFATSRMPVRVALRQLEAEELIVLRPHAGAWVSDVDPEDFSQTYQLREALEPFAIRASLPKLTDEHRREIHEHALRTAEVTGQPEHVEEFTRRDREFHLATFAGVRGESLYDRVVQLWNKTQRYRRVTVPQFSGDDHLATRADHELICYYIDHSDAEALGEVLRLHIRRTRILGESVIAQQHEG